MQRIDVLFVVLLVALSVAGCLGPSEPRAFEHEAFAFTIPAGWRTTEEVWGRPVSSGQEYYDLGVQEIVTVQYPPAPGKGAAFFTVASAPLVEGETLESLFRKAYEQVVPELRDVSQRPFQQGDLSGYEIAYRRPWGEPWWQFRDIWLARDGLVYVLSFRASPQTFDGYTDTFHQILKSFRFKD